MCVDADHGWGAKCSPIYPHPEWAPLSKAFFPPLHITFTGLGLLLRVAEQDSRISEQHVHN